MMNMGDSDWAFQDEKKSQLYIIKRYINFSITIS